MFHKNLNLKLVLVIILLNATACSRKRLPLKDNVVSHQVVPIDWKKFRKGNPSDPLAIKEREILLNTNRYALTTWYNKATKYSLQDSTYLTLKNIREPGSEAFALAVSIKTGVYDPSKTGVSLADAKKITLKLIGSVAYGHKVNQAGGWGNVWQSALWAGFAGFAGWLMWDELPPADQELVRRMVVYEADRFNKYDVPYYKSIDGKVNFKGDSKSEENSWNAMLLHVATAMMPHHANWGLWMNKNIELMLSANARPDDLSSSRVINGKKLSEVLKGSNCNSDGTITNHGFVHPDYMACTAHTFYNALTFTLAQRSTPEAAFFNTDMIYKALIDLEFPSPPSVPPGGTMYVPGSDVIYYPQNTDWGRGRRMNFALMDCQMSAFGMDRNVSKRGNYWEPLHAQAVLDMQNRSDDGSTYLTLAEDKFGGREEWVAAHAAQAYLTKWIIKQGMFSKTNQAY